MENTLQNNLKTVACTAAVVKLQKRMAKTLLSFCILFSMLMGINVMGYAQNTTQPVMQKTCSIAKGGAAVNFTVAGQLPDNARVSATSVSRTLPNGKQVMGAYDITITNGSSEWQPQAGQPVMVSITDPNFTDGVPMDVYHESANGKDFVATVASNNHTITFPAQSFSVYIVSGTDGTKRVKVIYKNGDTEIASYYVKPDDVDDPNYTMFNRIVYDPGAGTLSQYEVFRGWTTHASYTVNHVSSAMTIDDVREDLRTNHLTGTIAENAEVTYYAMIYKAFAISYVDENEVVLATESKLLPR
ncbi:MAG: hypothetical protein K5636_07850, partial [Bacteroidales bacterium]|nr:hypothetical protein [Bacteroidales bacterium]